MSNKKTYVEFGQIRKGDYGLYIKVRKDIKLTEGMNITMRKPEDGVKFFLEKGFIDENEAQNRIARIPDFVKYELIAKFEDND